jgi:hypothetical protein
MIHGSGPEDNNGFVNVVAGGVTGGAVGPPPDFFPHDSETTTKNASENLKLNVSMYFKQLI